MKLQSDITVALILRRILHRADFQALAALLLVMVTAIPSQQASAQQLREIISKTCISGDCEQGRGRMEIVIPEGKALYEGDFDRGEFHGYGRLVAPISRVASSVYSGNWYRGVRDGRGTYWNGDGKLYIGQWKNDKRHGQGSYFFGLTEWRENERTEFWMRENLENYTGEFKDDFYNGEGVYRWPDGQKYVGTFFANDKHGPGHFYYNTGTKRAQVWEYGNFVR